MLIKVLYGDNKLLLCNSTCSVVNLIRYIQNKTGLTDKDQIDLADETGLVAQLSAHPTEYADKYAASGTYILVEKQPRPDSGRATPRKNQDPYVYTSLLENYQELFPNLVQFHTASEKLEKLVRSKERIKLPSPSNTRKQPSTSKSSSKSTSPQRSTSKSPSSKKSANRANTQ